MAVKAKTVTQPSSFLHTLAVWAALVNADTGDPIDVSGAIGLTAILEAGGTLGVGGNCRWEGSMDGVNWFTMNSDIGAPAAANQAALSTPTMLKERPRFVRPNITAGDGTTSLVPKLAINKSQT